MKTDVYEELTRLKRTDLSDRYKAASIIMKDCGDSEMAEVLGTLSAQMDFDDNESAVDAIERTREKLDKLMYDRKARHADLYIKRLTDEEVLSVSGGEVTESDYDRLNSSYIKNGLFDPDIFGGEGKMLCVKSTDTIKPDSFGTGVGHIKMPIHVIFESDYRIIAGLLNMSELDVKKVAKYACYVVLEAGKGDPSVGTVLTEQEYNKIHGSKTLRVGIGGDALYEMLKNLGYSDKPERLAFSIVPVIAPKYRPLAYVSDTNEMLSVGVNHVYHRIVMRTNRLNKLIELKAPEIIIWNEKRMLDDYVNELQDAISAILKQIRHKSICFERKCQYAFALRIRNFKYEIPKGTKISDIESLNLYPKKIHVIDTDGLDIETDLGDIVDFNADAIHEYETSHMIEVPNDEEPSPEVQAQIDEVDERLKNMNEVYETVWDGAADERESFTVKLDEDLGMYVPYKVA